MHWPPSPSLLNRSNTAPNERFSYDALPEIDRAPRLCPGIRFLRGIVLPCGRRSNINSNPITSAVAEGHCSQRRDQYNLSAATRIVGTRDIEGQLRGVRTGGKLARRNIWGD